MAIFFRRFLMCVLCAGVVLPVRAEGSCGPALAGKIMQYRAGDVNQFLKYDCVIDNNKWKIEETPLEWAVSGYQNIQDNYAAVKAFLDAKPELANSLDYGHQHITMLALAVRSCCNDKEAANKPKIVEELLKHGAEVNKVLDNNKNDNGTWSHVMLVDETNRKVTALDVVRANIESGQKKGSYCQSTGITRCKEIEEKLLKYDAKTYAELNGDASTPVQQNTPAIVYEGDPEYPECVLKFSTGETLEHIGYVSYSESFVLYYSHDVCVHGNVDDCTDKTYPDIKNLISVNGKNLTDEQKNVLQTAELVSLGCLDGGGYGLDIRSFRGVPEEYKSVSFTVPENADDIDTTNPGAGCTLTFAGGESFSGLEMADAGKKYGQYYSYVSNPGKELESASIDYETITPRKMETTLYPVNFVMDDDVKGLTNNQLSESSKLEYRQLPTLMDLTAVNGKALSDDEKALLKKSNSISFFCAGNDYVIYASVPEENINVNTNSETKTETGTETETKTETKTETETETQQAPGTMTVQGTDNTVTPAQSEQNTKSWKQKAKERIQELFGKKGNKARDLKKEGFKIEADMARLQELQQAYDDAYEKEHSFANRMLGGLTMAATGIGGMELARGLAEQSADKAAEADMQAYLATFQCRIGDAGGKSYKGGEMGIEVSGGNQLTSLYQQYVDLAADLKERKTALGMAPGIESTVVMDKANMGLYDATGGSGVENGTYASLYRASRGNATDAQKLSEQKDASGTRVKAGAIAAGVGAVGGIVGNVLINGGDDDKKVTEADCKKVKGTYKDGKCTCPGKNKVYKDGKCVDKSDKSSGIAALGASLGSSLGSSGNLGNVASMASGLMSGAGK